jgi:DNA-binding NtrC family response regulator
MSDIPPLAQHFLQKVCNEEDKSISGFDQQAMEVLQDYHWPGNVRELQNIVERAVLLGKGPEIGIQDLPSHLTEGMMPTKLPVPAPGTRQTLKQALEGPERVIIMQCLRENNWNRNETADQLGINRTTLYKKMKRLGLENPKVAMEWTPFTRSTDN